MLFYECYRIAEFCPGTWVLPSPRGSNPKSPGRLQGNFLPSDVRTQNEMVFQASAVPLPLNYLPSSHGLGVLPGNQIGRSGPSGSHTADTPPLVAFARRPVFLVRDTAAGPWKGGGAGLGAWHARTLALLQNETEHGGEMRQTGHGVAAGAGRRDKAPWLTLAGGCMPRTSRRIEPWQRTEEKAIGIREGWKAVASASACVELPRALLSAGNFQDREGEGVAGRIASETKSLRE